MRVKLKGLNKATKTLADGSKATYFYAWRGGPKLEGEPGSPAFMAAYQAATATRTPPSEGRVFRGILDAYLDSEDFAGKAARTQRDYRRLIKIIDAEFGDLPLPAIGERGMRGEFRKWRDDRAKASKRQADCGWSVLALVLAWALEGEMIDANPCEKGGRLYDTKRVDKVWREEHEAAFMAVASAGMRLAMMLGLGTGQRQGDLLRLPWSAYDGRYIRLRQGKTGVRVTSPWARR